jgi:catechol 2,3-dioxygenase-like lactoylglutathione lyase family enzyme
MLRAIRAIDYIIILCQDIERMKRFYQAHLLKRQRSAARGYAVRDR